MSSSLGAILLSLLLLLNACSRTRPAPAPARIAVLRCENLSGDPQNDWMGRALSEVLAAQLEAPGAEPVVETAAIRATTAAMGARPAQAPGISAEREAAFAAGATRLLACDFTGTAGNIRVNAIEEDTFTQRNIGRSAADGSLFGAADALVRQISTHVRPSPTKSEEAIRAYAEALEAPDAEAARGLYARAVAADPNFGQAYMSWAQSEAAHQDRAAVERVVAQAEAHSSALSEYDRARLSLLVSELRGDLAGRARALATIAKEGPADSAVYQQLAEIALGGRRYRDAINYYHQAILLAPANVNLRNAAGYAEAYLGDYEGAIRTLREYERLRPTEANPLDSQGDVNFYFNRYADAEKLYLAAHQKDPNFLSGGELWKASLARLATGDVAGANGIFGRYASILDARHDPAAPSQKANFLYLTGKRREAVELLEQASKQPGVVTQIQLAQLAIWLLQLGETDAANRHIQDAAAALPSAEGRQIGVLAAFLAQPIGASPVEVQSRAQRIFGAAGDRFAGYALLFHRRYADAVPLLRHAWEESNPTSEEGLPVLLAWAMIDSEKWDGAIALLGPSPVPPGGFSPLLSLTFPRLFYLRGRLAAHQSKPDQAKANYSLFLKLAGPAPEIWGDEQRAREAAK